MRISSKIYRSRVCVTDTGEVAVSGFRHRRLSGTYAQPEGLAVKIKKEMMSTHSDIWYLLVKTMTRIAVFPRPEGWRIGHEGQGTTRSCG